MALTIINNITDGIVYAAYRPIFFRVYDISTRYPVVYCDIYFNGVYYKSLSSTAPSSGPAQGTAWTWDFDIQDAAQEYLRSFPPAMGAATIVQDSSCVARCFCKFRTASVDANGFIVNNETPPVQGNFVSQPVSGGGVQSVVKIILNATLQHEDNPDLATHLDAYTQFPNPDYKIRTLSHRTGYVSGYKQYDHTGVYVGWNGLAGGQGPWGLVMRIDGYYKSGAAFTATLATQASFTAPGVYHIPTGIAQLSTLAFSPVVSWKDVREYAVVLWRDFFFNIAWQSPLISTDGCTCDDGARLHFLNGLGTFDSVNFCEKVETLTTKSATWQKSLPIGNRWDIRDYGHQRSNVEANEEVTVRTNAYPETAQDWLKELARSTRAYLEGGGSDLVPVIINDAKVVTRKSEARFEYVLEVSYRMSNEDITQRG